MITTVITISTTTIMITIIIIICLLLLIIITMIITGAPRGRASEERSRSRGAVRWELRSVVFVICSIIDILI